MGTAPKASLLLLLAALALPARLSSQSITVAVAGATPKNWYVGLFGPSDIGQPGTNFTNSVQPVSPATQTVDIDVSGYPGAAPVLVSVMKAADETTTWNSSYTLWIRRVDDGSGTGSVTWVSTDWIQIVSTGYTDIFTVRRDRTGITAELQMRNMVVAAGTTSSSPSFHTTVTYRAFK